MPSPSSEFSHPDIVIGLTILGSENLSLSLLFSPVLQLFQFVFFFWLACHSYRYEGLRRADLLTVVKQLQQDMVDEIGPYHQRRSCRLWALWVQFAGSYVR